MHLPGKLALQQTTKHTKTRPPPPPTHTHTLTKENGQREEKIWLVRCSNFYRGTVSILNIRQYEKINAVIM